MDAGSHSISSEKSHAAAPRPPPQEAGFRPYMPSLSSESRRPSATATGSSPTGRRWTWTWHTTCSQTPFTTTLTTLEDVFSKIYQTTRDVRFKMSDDDLICAPCALNFHVHLMAPGGRHIAVGLNSSDVQLWDTNSNRLSRTLRGVHEARVGSLVWNNSILTTGGMDGKIVNNDVRIRNHVVQTYRGTARRCADSSGLDQGSSWPAEATTTYVSMASSLPSAGHKPTTSGCIGSRTTWPP